MRISDWSSDVCSSDLGEEAVAVVVRQHRLGVEAGGGGACKARRAAERAGVVLAAVDAVGVAGEGVDTGGSLKRDGQRQQELGVAPAAPLAEIGRASCRERVCKSV